MASLLSPKFMSIPTIDAREEMFDVRLLPPDDSGASITVVLYILGMLKATMIPKIPKAMQ